MMIRRRGSISNTMIWGVILLVGIAGGVFLWQRHVESARNRGAREMPPRVVTDLIVRRETTPLPLEYVGQTAGFKEVELRARVGGTLLKRSYTEGQRVKAGELMFTIDPESHRAVLQQMRAELQRATVQRDRAKIERDRVVALHAKNAVSDADRDDAMTAYAVATAAVQTATAAVRQAEINLQWTQVRAPISGITGQETRSEGNLVTPDAVGSLLTTIVQLDPLYVDFAVPADEYRRNDGLRSDGLLVRPGKGASVEIVLADGSVFTHQGTINFQDQVAEPQTGAIRMRAKVPNPGGNLLPGQFVRVRVLGNSLKDVILIPQRSVMMTQAGHQVYVLDEANIPAARSVDIALSVGTSYLISRGLEDGERIVQDGVFKVVEGAAVMIASGAPSAESEPSSADKSEKE